MITSDTNTHYSYPLITWGSTLMGAAVAIIISIMLNMLGVSLGLAAAAVGKTSGAAATGGIIGLVWMVASNLAALAYGAWVAARSTPNPDHHSGTLQGIAVWAVTSLIVVFLAGSAISGAASTMMQTAGAASSQTVARENDRGTLQDRAQNAVDNAQAQVDNNQQEIQDDAVKTAGVSSLAALGTFLAMLLGLVGAIIGARAGASHPEWKDRPRMTYVNRNDHTIR